MNMIVCGIDISKGYCESIVTLPDGSVFVEQRLDDTPDGHRMLLSLLTQAHELHPTATIRCGMENTGGLERNWLRTLRVFAQEFNDRELPSIEVLSLNPLAVTMMLRHQIHRAVTDAHSARGIAHYLRVIASPTASTNPLASEGLRMLLGLLTAQGRQERRLRNQLQTYLPFAFPELVPFCRAGVPGFVLDIIERYPSPQKLARAHIGTLARIPHLGRERAEALHRSAKESITSVDRSREALQVAEDTALTLRECATMIRVENAQKTHLESLLINRTQSHEAFPLLVSIPGIGKASAAKIIAILGEIARFPNASQLIAFAGLDPRVRESGDMRSRRSITKRGNPTLRSLLFINAHVAVQHPGPLQDLYTRLQAAGKPYKVAMVACMNKLLRIIYACWISGEMFDPKRDQQHAKAQTELKVETTPKVQTEPKPLKTRIRHNHADIPAPVSWREAKRRREEKERKEVSLPKRE